MAEEVVAPVEEVKADPAPAAPEATPTPTPVEADAEAKTDDEAKPEGEAKDEGDAEPPKKPWYYQRIDTLAAQRDIERRLRAEHEIRLAAYELRFGKLEDQQEAQPAAQPASGASATGDAPPQKPVVRPSQRTFPADQVKHEAERIAAHNLRVQAFNEECNSIAEAGKKEFGAEFDTSIQTLTKDIFGGDSRAIVPFYEAVIETGAGAKVLHALGKDPDEAARIAALPPMKQAVALEQLAAKLRAPKPVSGAPKPITPVNGKAATPSGLVDNLPMDEWVRRRNKQIAEARG